MGAHLECHLSHSSKGRELGLALFERLRSPILAIQLGKRLNEKSPVGALPAQRETRDFGAMPADRAVAEQL